MRKFLFIDKPKLSSQVRKIFENSGDFTRHEPYIESGCMALEKSENGFYDVVIYHLGGSLGIEPSEAENWLIKLAKLKDKYKFLVVLSGGDDYRVKAEKLGIADYICSDYEDIKREIEMYSVLGSKPGDVLYEFCKNQKGIKKNKKVTLVDLVREFKHAIQNTMFPVRSKLVEMICSKDFSTSDEMLENFNELREVIKNKKPLYAKKTFKKSLEEVKNNIEQCDITKAKKQKIMKHLKKVDEVISYLETANLKAGGVKSIKNASDILEKLNCINDMLEAIYGILQEAKL